MTCDHLQTCTVRSPATVPERKLWSAFWEAPPEPIVEPLPSTKVGIAHVSRLDYAPEDHVYPVLMDTHVITLNLLHIPEVQLDVGGLRWERPVPRGAITILPARSQMRLKVRSNYDCIIFFIPDSLVQETARDVGLVIDTKALLSPVVEDMGLRLLAQETAHAIVSASSPLEIYQSEMMVKAFTARLLSQFALITDAKGVRGGLAPYIVRRVMARIESNLEAPPSLTDLASAARLSPFHFCRAFRQSTGTSLSKFIVNKRIEKAKVLLSTTDLPVAEIATTTGYQSGSHFAHMFKRVMGMSPTQFRSR